MTAAAAPARRFEPHNRVAGKFRLRRRLAAGGMGEVWVARNESTGADLAIKVLRRGDADRASELQIEERFRHEARLSAMLSHRSIVKVFDLVEEPDGTLVLVMELLRGESLQSYLERKGPRPAREAVAIVCPILSALQHAHERGIVHRDVTPSNIFLAMDPDGHVTPKLVDFGIAKLATGAPPSSSPPRSASKSLPQPVQTVDGQVLGTPRYMAPERIRGSSDIDGRADVFAAAVVLYETLTGASPFAASSPSASLAAVLERHIDPDERIDPRLWIEIQRALSKQPYERHTTAQEMANALRAAIGESEGALEASLKRTRPPSAWEDDDETDTGLDAVAEDARSIDGQSVAVIPRRRGAGLTWLAAGVAVGGIVGGVMFALHGSAGAKSAAAGAEPPAASAPAMSTASSAQPRTTAIATATASGSETAAAAPATTAAATAPARFDGPAPPSPTVKPAAPHTRRHTTPKPRPVATTPGF